MALSRTTRVNLLLGNGHFLSHFYSLCLPPLFLAWQAAFQRELRGTGPCRCADGGRLRHAADAGRLPGGSLRRAPVPDRRRAADVALHHRHGVRHQLLADPGAGPAVRHGQLGVPSGGLCDPVGLGGQGPHGPRVRAAHVQRQPGLRRRAAGHGAAGDDAGLARQPDHGRAARRAGCDIHRAAERHPEGPGPPRADARGPRALRPASCC